MNLMQAADAQPSPSKKPAKPKLLGTSETSPLDHNKRKEIEVRVRKPVIVFYIGGAGDKRGYPIPTPGDLVGPYKNIVEVSKSVADAISPLKLGHLYQSAYLGYYDIFGDANIQKNVLPAIPDKSTPLIIIGHSLGAWNGAHLSHWLSKAGYNVEVLVTLDPVGEGVLVTATSNIYSESPKAEGKIWINVKAETKKGHDFSDFIARFGEQWT